MSATSQMLGFGPFFLVAYLWVLIIGRARAAARHLQSHRPADATPPAGSAGRYTIPYHCATYGHYYQRRDGAWVCRCGDRRVTS